MKLSTKWKESMHKKLVGLDKSNCMIAGWHTKLNYNMDTFHFLKIGVFKRSCLGIRLIRMSDSNVT